MLERTAVAEALAAELEGALVEPVISQGLDGLHLLAKAGGRQANFSPIPWVRAFSKRVRAEGSRRNLPGLLVRR